MPLLDELAVPVTALTSGFVAGMETAKKSLNSFVDNFSLSAFKFNQVSQAFGTLRNVLQQMRAPFAEISQLGRFAERLGTNVDEIQKLEFIGTKAGLSLEEMVVKLGRLQVKLGDAGEASNATGKALERLGIDAQEIGTASPLDALKQLAEGIKGLGTQTQRASVLQDAFGRGGLELLPVLNKGAAGVQALSDRAEKYTLLTEEQVKASRGLTREVGELEFALKKLELQLTATTSSALEAAVKGTAKAVEGLEDLAKRHLQSQPRGKIPVRCDCYPRVGRTSSGRTARADTKENQVAARFAGGIQRGSREAHARIQAASGRKGADGR